LSARNALLFLINEYRSCNHRWTCIEKNKYNTTTGDRCCL